MNAYPVAIVDDVWQAGNWWSLSFSREDSSSGDLWYEAKDFRRRYQLETGRNFARDYRGGKGFVRIRDHFVGRQLKFWHQGWQGYAELV